MFFVKKLSAISIFIGASFLTVSLPAYSQNATENGQGSSIVFLKPPTGFGPSQLRLTSEVLSLFKDSKVRAFLSAANFNVSSINTSENTYRVVLDGKNVIVPVKSEELAELGLPAVADVVSVDINIWLDSPWNKIPMYGKPLSAKEITVKNLILNWGIINVTGNANLSVDADGMITGEALLNIFAWQDMLNIAPISDDHRAVVQQIMGVVAGDDSSISLPITLENSNIMVGSNIIATIPPLLLP